MRSSLSRAAFSSAAFLLSCAAASQSRAAAIEIVVSGIGGDKGEIGCALYSGEDGFPMEPERATRQWLPARAGAVTCRFEGIGAGRYAVAVSHDLNGNRITDTNFLGIPTEPWGVSNGVRPSFRAPTFEEALVIVGDEAATVPLRVEVGQ